MHPQKEKNAKMPSTVPKSKLSSTEVCPFHPLTLPEFFLHIPAFAQMRK